MIEIRGLMKKFGRREVLKGIGFSAGAGEPITLLGPNGAGCGQRADLRPVI